MKLPKQLPSLFQTLPLSVIKQVSFHLYPHRMDSLASLYKLQQILKRPDCSVVDIVEVLQLLLQSNRVEAVGIQNLEMNMQHSYSAFLKLLETSASTAHALRLRFTEDSSYGNVAKETSLARFVSELVSRDKALYYLDVNDSGLDLSIHSLLDCKLLDSLSRATSLCYLRIRDVSLDAAGAVLLSRMLVTQNSLKLLEIGHNPIGDKGVCALVECLKTQKRLLFLVLCSYDVTSVGATALAKSLEANTSLDMLYMKDDNLGAAAGQAFAEMLKINQSLRRLHLDYCDLTPEGCEPFVEAISKNRMLKHLRLNHSGIGFHDKAALVRAAREGKVLEIMEVEDRNELVEPDERLPQYIVVADYTRPIYTRLRPIMRAIYWRKSVSMQENLRLQLTEQTARRPQKLITLEKENNPSHTKQACCH